LPPSHGLPFVSKHQRLTPEERQDFADRVIKAYREGASIRALMRESGRSYGAIHRILAETPGVRMRSRGGVPHDPASQKAPNGEPQRRT
jgi:hypothetical protein